MHLVAILLHVRVRFVSCRRNMFSPDIRDHEARKQPIFGAHPGMFGDDWESAFSDEADAEVRAMFDRDLGLA